MSWSATPGPAVEAALHLVLAAGAYRIAAVHGWTPRVEAALVAAACFHGLYAAFQRFVWLPRLAAELAGAEGSVEALAAQRAAGGRAFSTLLLPGHLGALLAALALVLAVTATGEIPARRRRIAVAGLVASGIGLVLSAGLGGVVALGAVALAWAAASLRARRGAAARAIVAGVVLSAVAVVLLRAGDLGSWSDRDHPLAPRLRMWHRALEVAALHPVAGAGLGSYPVRWLRFAEAGDVPARHAHMSYLEVAAETGITGLALLAGFLVAALRSARHPAPALGAAVLLVHAAGDFDFQSGGLLVACFALLGVAAGPRPGATSRPARLAVALLLAAGAALAAAREAGRIASSPGAASLAAPAEIARRVRVWPVDAAALGALGRAEAEAGRLDAALSAIRRARSLEPETAWLAALESDLCVRRGEAFASWFAARDAVRLYPARPEYGRSAAALETAISTARPGSGTVSR